MKKNDLFHEGGETIIIFDEPFAQFLDHRFVAQFERARHVRKRQDERVGRQKQDAGGGERRRGGGAVGHDGMCGVLRK